MFSCCCCRHDDVSEGLTVLGSAHVAGPEYTVTNADAGPPVGLPAGTGKATGLAKVKAARAVMLVRTEGNCMLDELGLSLKVSEGRVI
jgi:hypothetical protein